MFSSAVCAPDICFCAALSGVVRAGAVHAFWCRKAVAGGVSPGLACVALYCPSIISPSFKIHPCVQYVFDVTLQCCECNVVFGYQ